MVNTSSADQPGLYTPELESDACGTGMFVNLDNKPSNSIVDRALQMLERMEHRGACGCEPESGDGAGITTQLPHAYYRKLASDGELPFFLPDAGSYGTGLFFFPKSPAAQKAIREEVGKAAELLGFELVGFREVPTRPGGLGPTALSTEPYVTQPFFATSRETIRPEPLPDARRRERALAASERSEAARTLDRRLYVLRKLITANVRELMPRQADDFYICSLSSRTIVYKGQLTSHQVRSYYPDLSHPDYTSAIAQVHSRFATNTNPRWRLAQPFRFISHNGEINTVQGNVNWWRSREAMLQSDVFTPVEMEILLPILDAEASDSGSFDNVLEFLVHAGRSIPHALMMMIPEAWQNDRGIGQAKRDFYEYHEMLMEPWDGPASICFTDGTLVGATLDRNGLRPSRYVVTKDNELILASETGVIDIPARDIVRKDRLEPGKILIADLDQGRIVGDDELKEIICNQRDYNDWLAKDRIHIKELPIVMPGPIPSEPLRTRQLAHGLTKEDRELILRDMSKAGKEPIGSMGADTPLAALSEYAQHIANYFRQQFAQVTNPPIDPLREADFMTLKTFLGSNGNILDTQRSQVKGVRIDSPVLSVEEYFRLRFNKHPSYVTEKIDCRFGADYQSGDLKTALERIADRAEAAVASGATVLFLSNHHIGPERVPVPSLLSCGAVHHRLIQSGRRRQVALVINASDVYETHHFATLLSYGADAVYPRIAYETIAELAREKFSGPETMLFQSNYRNAVEGGLLKIMSKLGVSTVLSYKGAQTFEALGIGREVIDLCFRGTISRIGGLTFDQLAREALVKHRLAFKDGEDDLQDLGKYAWRRRGEYHLFNPASIHLLQHATRTGDYQTYKKFAREIDRLDRHNVTLRSLLDFAERTPVPLDEVEPVEEILTRFATGAMSFGSISYEAHTSLAIAMNRIGGKSNSGEGGEDERRYHPLANGDSMRSAIKQVASGRFGVTSYYLTNADDIQIKMAQGAKPGEGGQLPGHKVDDWIARVRHSTPGVGLISPPPHHDIYSIEDLAQLIFDLKNANPKARISVKLVSKAGVGIIASGVTKGHADHILISGHDGGTGASPLSSIQHAGLPWEMGLAETHQTLLRNQLRGRVRIQADGQMRTGRDLAVATLLGAEEWGVATAALVVEGCILMRKCHLNTCPVGIATQDPELRAKYDGRVEDLVNYFTFLATDLRERMAELGFRTVDEMVGRADALYQRREGLHSKARSVDLAPVLHLEDAKGLPQYACELQDHGIDDVLDRRLIERAQAAILDAQPVSGNFDIANTDRAVGAMLSNQVSLAYGIKGLPEDTIRFRFRGSAGQSFGAFLAPGITFTCEGDTNDYFGKGLSGGRVVVIPDRDAGFEPSENIIVGNVGLYGATSGEVYIRGRAGERFAVRNSGVTAVVEGVGAHGCEYMTGGQVIILGHVGRNFAAGMSGGTAFLLNPNEDLERYCNTDMVWLEQPATEDLRQLKVHIKRHFRFTGSSRALALLQNWEDAARQFVKVMPKDYKRVLARQAAAAMLAAEAADGGVEA